MSEEAPVVVHRGLEEKDKGNAMFKEKKWGAALRHYTNAIKLEDDNHVYYSNRCACLLKVNKDSRALKDAEKCISLKPEWAKGYFRKGCALSGLRKHYEALTSLHKAITIASDSGRSRAVVPKDFVESLVKVLRLLDVSERANPVPYIIEKGMVSTQNEKMSEYLKGMQSKDGVLLPYNQSACESFTEKIWTSSISRLFAGVVLEPTLYFLTGYGTIGYLNLNDMPLNILPNFLALLLETLQLHAVVLSIHRSNYPYPLPFAQTKMGKSFKFKNADCLFLHAETRTSLSVHCTPSVKSPKLFLSDSKYGLPPNEFQLIPPILQATKFKDA